MQYSDNPYDDFRQHEYEIEKRLSRRPICHECGERIQDDYGYQLNGRWICADCLEVHRVEIEEE